MFALAHAGQVGCYSLVSLSLEALTFYTADHREAVQAFLEKRDPVFGQG